MPLSARASGVASDHEPRVHEQWRHVGVVAKTRIAVLAGSEAGGRVDLVQAGKEWAEVTARRELAVGHAYLQRVEQQLGLEQAAHTHRHMRALYQRQVFRPPSESPACKKS